MRIAYYIPSFLPSSNGIVTRMRYTLHELRKQGHEVIIVAPQQLGLPSEYEGFTILGVPSFPLWIYPGFRLALPWYANKMTREKLISFQPELVHVVDPLVGLGTLARKLAKELKVPLVTSYHTNVVDYLNIYGWGGLRQICWGYIRWIHARADVTLCPSMSTQELLYAHRFAKLKVWRSGVDTTQFHPQAGSQAWRNRLTDQHPERYLLLSVGRLAREKHIERLFPLLKVLNKEKPIPLFHLAIIGDGPHEAKLKKWAEGLPITFMGRLSGPDLPAAIASGDSFCLLSQTETFGNSTQEAMACGRVVVAVRSAGACDLICDGETGLLIEPGHSEQFLMALRTLQQDESLRTFLGAAARESVSSWSWLDATQALCHVYEEEIKKSLPAAPLKETAVNQ